jgi:hypothetical protein
MSALSINGSIIPLQEGGACAKQGVKTPFNQALILDRRGLEWLHPPNQNSAFVEEISPDQPARRT